MAPPPHYCLTALTAGSAPISITTSPTVRHGEWRRWNLMALARDRRAAEAAPGAPPAPARVAYRDAEEEGQMVEFNVDEESWFSRRPVRELALPRGCLLVAIRRGQRTLIPSGGTVLHAGDHVTALLSPEAAAAFEQWLQAPPRAA